MSISARQFEAIIQLIISTAVAIGVTGIFVLLGGSVRATDLPIVISGYVIAGIFLTMRPLTGSIDYAVKAFRLNVFLLGAGFISGVLVEFVFVEASASIMVLYGGTGILVIFASQTASVADWYRGRAVQARREFEQNIEENHTPSQEER